MKNSIKVLLLLSLSTVIAVSTTIHTKRKISSTYDDAEENIITRKINLNGPLHFVTHKGQEFITGLRFKNIKVPKGVTITNAYIQFTAKEKNSETTNLTIQGELAHITRKFKGKSGNISSRTKTISSVDWNDISSWERASEKGDKQKTSDLSPIIQEIIDQDDWHKGKAMGFFISGTGNRVAKSAHHKTLAPVLYIEYDDTVAAPTNHPPLAEAGSNQTHIMVNNIPISIQLDGSTSSDLDGDPITYTWNFIGKPIGSNPILSDNRAVNPIFNADRAGVYILQLVVNDGVVNSPIDTVTITINSNQNTAPIANAGTDQTLLRGEDGTFVQLDGSASIDLDGDPISYEWRFILKPLGSTATLDNPYTMNPSFWADVPGDYYVLLIADDNIALFPGLDPVTITIQ